MQTSKRLGQTLRDNLWVIILDIIAVNASYYLAFIIRFSLNGRILGYAAPFLPTYFKFAPYYTILCIIIFWLLHMYDGMWKFAGIDDMNRIIVANIYTALVQILGTLIFYGRMPRSYYIVGAILQLVFTVMIRFVPRFLLMEKSRFLGQKSAKAKAIIIGMNGMGRMTARNLREVGGFKVTCYLDSQESLDGRMINGVPVYGLDKLDNLLGNHTINAVFIADPLLTKMQVKRIREACTEVNVIDMTGFLNNQSGFMTLSALIEVTDGPIVINIDSTDTEYPSGYDAIRSLRDKYSVLSVSVKDNLLYVKLKKDEAGTFSGFDDWANRYKDKTGEELSFF